MASSQRVTWHQPRHYLPSGGLQPLQPQAKRNRMLCPFGDHVNGSGARLKLGAALQSSISVPRGASDPESADSTPDGGLQGPLWHPPGVLNAPPRWLFPLLDEDHCCRSSAQGRREATDRVRVSVRLKGPSTVAGSGCCSSARPRSVILAGMCRLEQVRTWVVQS